MTIPYRRNHGALGAFFAAHRPERFGALDADGRALLCEMGACLEPFLHLELGEAAPEPDVPGFEGVALGAEGESFGELMARARALGVDGGDLRLAMLLAVLHTAEALIGEATRAEIPGTDELLFTANLDAPLLDTGLVRAALATAPGLEPRLLLEVSEALPDDHVPAVLDVVRGRSVGLALDDVEGMDPAVQARLVPHARMVKVSATHARDMLADRDLSTMAEGLRGVLTPGCPTVLEGLSREKEHEFLRSAWRPEWGPLWVQSHAGRDTGRWSPLLRPLSAHRGRGGFYLPAASKSS